MRVKVIKIKNFRGFKDEVKVEIGDLTAFVGKNDIGKSTILEALEIFFNEGKGIIKISKEDINKEKHAEGVNEITISICFDELPKTILIDDTNHTTLQNEYLLNSEKQLEIIKSYTNGNRERVFIKAYHPTNPICKDLLQKTNTELQHIIKENSVDCSNLTKNAVMRSAIWQHFSSDLQLQEIEVDISKGESKSIWDKLRNYLPQYHLFQSDRKNSDGDNEVQDPLRVAVKQILTNEKIRNQFDEIAKEVKATLEEVSARTLEKVHEMNPEIASGLNPVIPETESLKWADVFKSVSIVGDESISINKRGSGVKRLILLNFFRAEVERIRLAQNVFNIVYAIEEPETSQHSEHQKKIIKALLELSKASGTQVIITSHSATVVKLLEFNHLRLVKSCGPAKVIEEVSPGVLAYPSLNEVNYIAFSEITEEYHNELYGFLCWKKEIKNYLEGKRKIRYTRLNRDLVPDKTIDVTLSEYIRHQIHHPENKHNERYTDKQLKESIESMRGFIRDVTK
jgi:predicted ATP-dependent endonuclease of OLD family